MRPPSWTEPSIGRVPGHYICPLAGLRQRGVCRSALWRMGSTRRYQGFIQRERHPLRIVPLCDYVNCVEKT